MSKKTNAVALTDGIKWDASSVSHMLKVLTKATTNIQKMKALTAAACVMHAIDHGNATPMTQLIVACGQGERNDAIVKWAIEFGPFKWERDADLKQNVFKMDTGKRAALANKGAAYVNDLVKTPFWVFVPQKEVPAFNMLAALKVAIGRADKAMKDEARKAKSDFTAYDDVKALLAKYMPEKNTAAVLN